ncbi:glutamate-5-semialdehyde dehydrogenase [Halalkalibacter akibai]|uniref:Gamma-glutamyl phosphate reductase n=1 Tax=Halalkalibacter akibai (strain ATCC 43226 / DSM 21942 / CIP 109018 / JCM 9157 / 1139) TaxID=1236973 RepID=W4QPE1_HALA3|nr:glutamate-5-semialdehyde dehydrogenase [Halalkalibacter akibai]GAE33528.1 gamma-glutamyl phosphate reductase [Halalkalibacter akibai JCM 9157]
MSELLVKARKANECARILATISTEEKNAALQLIAEQLLIEEEFLLTENKKDIIEARNNGTNEGIIDRLTLNAERLRDMAEGLKQVASLPDPVGEILTSITRPNGLNINKVRVPLGVIGMIYEARPNVTIDASSLCLKAGNAVILRGSSSAIHSNIALVQVVQRALDKTTIPVEAIQLIEDTSRQTATEMFTLNEYLDVLIPRGGASLIQSVVNNASVPVLETGVGNCHLYIDETAQTEMAISIAVNAKTQRPSVCNAVETILIHEKWASTHFEDLLVALIEKGVSFVGDEKTRALDSRIELASETDWKDEFLDLKVALKVVNSVDEAIEHIYTYGTKHSESIISEDALNVESFLNKVDAAAVYHNASTRFTDGFEFGFGAEIGISTQKLHARGPMGLEALTSTKYIVHGTGQVKG